MADAAAAAYAGHCVGFNAPSWRPGRDEALACAVADAAAAAYAGHCVGFNAPSWRPGRDEALAGAVADAAVAAYAGHCIGFDAPSWRPGRDEALAGAVAEAAAAAGLASLVSVRVVHCAHAFGCVLTGRAGWKLAFRWAARGFGSRVHLICYIGPCLAWC